MNCIHQGESTSLLLEISSPFFGFLAEFCTQRSPQKSIVQHFQFLSMGGGGGKVNEIVHLYA